MTLGARGRVAVRRRVVTFLAVAAPVSFLLGVALTRSSPPDAFFLLPARAWELCVGGLVGLLAARRLPGAAAGPLAWIGLAAIATAVARFDGSTPFPGTAGLLPVLGTALVLLAAGSGPSTVAHGLSTRPLQVVGRYSYSLYLWHWPLLIVGAIALPSIGQSWVRASVVLVAAAVPLWVASYHLVEDPVRSARWLVRRPDASLALGAAIVLTGVLVARLSTVGLAFDDGSIAAAAGPCPTPVDVVPSNLRPGLRAAADDLPALYDVDGCDTAVDTTAPVPCVFGDPSSDRTVVLLGGLARWAVGESPDHDRRGGGLAARGARDSRAARRSSTTWVATHAGRGGTPCSTIWKPSALTRWCSSTSAGGCSPTGPTTGRPPPSGRSSAWARSPTWSSSARRRDRRPMPSTASPNTSRMSGRASPLAVTRRSRRSFGSSGRPSSAPVGAFVDLLPDPVHRGALPGGRRRPARLQGRQPHHGHVRPGPDGGVGGGLWCRP